MVNEGCYYGTLCTEDETILFKRGDKHTDTLYMSQTFGKGECPIFAVFCWMAAACGLVKPKLPEPVVTWKEEELYAQGITASGVVQRSDHIFLDNVNNSWCLCYTALYIIPHTDTILSLAKVQESLA